MNRRWRRYSICKVDQTIRVKPGIAVFDWWVEIRTAPSKDKLRGFAGKGIGPLDPGIAFHHFYFGALPPDVIDLVEKGR